MDFHRKKHYDGLQKANLWAHDVKITERLRSLIASRIEAIKKAFDIRDVFIFGGLAMLGYGLWLFAPWIGYAVTGIAMMALGLGWLFRRPA